MFKKKQLSEKAMGYVDEVNKYVDNCSDENILNLIFTEVTILRMELDKFDSIINNIRDAIKRRESFSKKELIKVQIFDICKNYDSFKENDKKKTDLIMRKILPQKEDKSIWEWIGEYFDNATGKH